MNEIRYEIPQKDVDYNLPSIFLAGPTVRGNQPHLISWRFEAVEEFKKQGFQGNVIIPEFSNKLESDKNRIDIPLWEFEGLRKCDVIMFWIPRTRELIGLTTNCEFGYWMASHREKVIYGRPNDAYRIQYLDIMWQADYSCKYASQEKQPIYTTLADTVIAAIKKCPEKTDKTFKQRVRTLFF